MSPDIIEKVKGFLMNPTETFKDAKSDELGEAFKYFIVILAIDAVLTGLLVMAGINAYGVPGMGTGIAGGIATIVSEFIGGIIGIFIVGLIIHIFVALIIGGNGIEQTIKAIMYGATPVMLFGWIPYIGILGGLWSLALYILGIRELHETTTGRAAAAVLIPVVGLILILIVALAAFLIAGNMISA
jgi:hypothetical protein